MTGFLVLIASVAAGFAAFRFYRKRGQRKGMCWLGGVSAGALVLAVGGLVFGPDGETPQAQAKASVPAHSSTAAEAPHGIDAYNAMEEAALAGDYQAQRNIAYTLSTGLPHDPVLGCAWRIVIVDSASSQADSTDVDNKALYCDQRLNADDLKLASAKAVKLERKIARGASNR